MAVKTIPTSRKIEAMTMTIMLQLAVMKMPPILIPYPVPSSLDSILSLSITDSARLEVVEGRRLLERPVIARGSGDRGSEGIGLKALLPLL